ncbi:hypothetical protein Tco_0336112 [Tanacetum coccineum]
MQTTRYERLSMVREKHTVKREVSPHVSRRLMASLSGDSSQETPGDLTTGDHLSPKVKVFLIPVIEGQDSDGIRVSTIDNKEGATVLPMKVSAASVIEALTTARLDNDFEDNLFELKIDVDEDLSNLAMCDLQIFGAQWEAYDKVFNHLDMLHAPLEGKEKRDGDEREWGGETRERVRGEEREMERERTGGREDRKEKKRDERERRERRKKEGGEERGR